nr:MAG TPA: hypothetical protein [Caudoviricetes sp.]
MFLLMIIIIHTNYTFVNTFIHIFYTFFIIS